MKIKKKPCDGCGNDKVIWKNHQGKRYCKQCWSAHSVSTQPKPTAKQSSLSRRSQKRIAPRSKKKIQEDAEYSKKRKNFLDKHPMCEAHLPGICSQKAIQVHHKGGRIGTRYLDDTTWLAVCHECHHWIETHPEQAREMGLSTTKH